MSKARKHHFAPQTYLRQFADPDERLTVYDRILKEKRYRQPIRDVAAKANLYSIVDDDGELNDYLEKHVFEPIDAEISRILPKLVEDRPQLTNEDRENVNAFIALQHMRTLYMRDVLDRVFDLLLRSQIEAGTRGKSPEEVERFLEEFDPRASDGERAVFRQIAENPSKPVAMDPLYWVRGMVRILPSIAAGLNTRQWRLADAREGAFLSCDVPVGVGGLHPLAIADAPYLLWPISPSRVLLLGEPGSWNGRSWTGSLAPQESVITFNQLMADQAARQVFWHPDTEPTAGINLPEGPHLNTINGIEVGADEWFYDVVRAGSHELDSASDTTSGTPPKAGEGTPHA